MIYDIDDDTVESHDYAPPLCMLGLGESGERGLIRGHLTFPYDDHYWPSNAVWACDLYFLWLFGGQKSRKSSPSSTLTRPPWLLSVLPLFLNLVIHPVHSHIPLDSSLFLPLFLTLVAHPAPSSTLLFLPLSLNLVASQYPHNLFLPLFLNLVAHPCHPRLFFFCLSFPT